MTATTPRRVLALAALALAIGPAARASGLVVTREVERSSCGALVESWTHPMLASGQDGALAWTDTYAHDWRIGDPVAYRGDAEALASADAFRVGDGAVRVEARLEPRAGRFQVRIVPVPRGDFDLALAQYLPGVALPCEASGSLRLVPDDAQSGDAARVEALYRHLHTASEGLYDQQWSSVREHLARAEELAPDSDVVAWMQARAAYLEGEALPASDTEGRLREFRESEAFADRAVALAPDRAEGWLWRAIARGRITTTQAALRTAFAAIARERGPRWVADCFERAIALRARYVNFGFSAHGDALAGAAQLYRLLPRNPLAGAVIGVERDLDRAVSLAREALALQPTRIEYAKELGVALLCRGAERGNERDVSEGAAVLERAQTLPVRTPYERTDQRHARELLASAPDRACGYSRDTWELRISLLDLS